MKLFAIGNGSVSDYLRSNISSLKDKIASYTDEQIMNSDFDEWVEALYFRLRALYAVPGRVDAVSDPAGG